MFNKNISINILSNNWVTRRDTVENLSLVDSSLYENILIELLEDNVPVALAAAKKLGDIKSTKAIKSLCSLFNKINNNPACSGVAESVFYALGQSNKLEALLFIGRNIAANSAASWGIKKSLIKALGYFSNHAAIAKNFLYNALEHNPKGELSKIILTGLCQLGDFSDAEKIEQAALNSLPKLSKQNKAFQEATAREGFSDMSGAFDYLFIQACIHRIKNANMTNYQVIGNVGVDIDPNMFEKSLNSLGAFAPTETKNWYTNEIKQNIIPAKHLQYLREQSKILLGINNTHPEIEAIRFFYKENHIPFLQGEKGCGSFLQDARLSYWSKDGSLMIPHYDRLIPIAPFIDGFPVGGESVAIAGKNPLQFVSGSIGMLQLKQLEISFPDITFIPLPSGYLTVRLPSSKIALLETSHIDPVINAIPRTNHRNNKAVLLIDPLYFLELNSYSELKLFFEKKLSFFDLDIILIPENERHLCSTNFSILPDNRVLLNHAPQTYRLLLDCGIKKETLLMLNSPLERLSFLGGNLGCTSGLYSEDRVSHQLLN